MDYTDKEMLLDFYRELKFDSDSEMPFDFEQIDTTRIYGMPDEMLLEMIKTIRWAEHNVGGWGLVAELAKRYSFLIHEISSDSD